MIKLIKAIIEKGRYFSILAVLTLLLTFALSLLWGIAQAVKVWERMVVTYGQSPDIILAILKLIDVFLITIVVYMLAVSIYELFIGKVELSSRLVARSLAELKVKMSGVIVLVMAVHFVEVIFDEKIVGQEKLWQAIAISIVSLALVAFNYFGSQHDNDVTINH